MKDTTFFLSPNLTDYEETARHFSWDNWNKEFSFHTTGQVNYAYEVSDFQVLKGHGEKHAFISQKVTGEITRITFRQLAEQTTILAGALRARGLQPGDRFGLYAYRSVEYAVVLLAAIKCGAIVVPLFPAFGHEAVADRLIDCSATWLYVASDLVPNVPFAALSSLRSIITEHLRAPVPPAVKTYHLSDCLQGSADSSVVQFGDLETPFIIHYTSGSTAKPKGILLASRAMLGHLVTAKYVLDLHPEDHYWNSGDPGWVTGMVYNFFAPLLLGVTAHLYEGPFNSEAWVAFMSRMGISVWYSTPTAFRLLRYHGAPLNREHLPSLRHIVSAGEPVNPSLIEWTMQNLHIPIHDSWYMTENGHQLINNYPGVPIKNGSMGKPLPGVVAAIIDDEGKEVPRGVVGRLAIKIPWPGMMKTVWNNPERFKAYFQNEWYISGDSAWQDEDGYFWFQGREDDMIKSAGERISPFEVESALVSHPQVAEAGVIGKPDAIFGTLIKAFILLKPGVLPAEQLKTELMAYFRQKLGKHGMPREIEFVERLPKTRSGKIMRRVLRAREMSLDAGDLSTLDAEMNPEEVAEPVRRGFS